jgi:hypothetical protein
MTDPSNQLSYSLPVGVVRLFQFLAIVGGIALAVGLFQVPERTWVDLFLVGNYLVGLALGGLVLLALFYITGARWSLPLQRVPEAMAAVLPVAAVALFAVFLCWPSLYSWSGRHPAEIPESPLMQFWLDRPFFLVRALVYFALWLALGMALVRASRRQQSDRASAAPRPSVRLSAAFLVVFGVTCWLASADWIMSLEPAWASTIFGVYNFAGLFVSALAAITLLVLALRRQGPLQAVVREDHLHDFGTLLFAFSSFWMYTWFCQYLLIWYVDNPEETSYFRLRWDGAWPAVVLLDLVLNWGLPFVVLLFRSAKRNPLVLGTMAVAILAGRWVDLFVMILPSQGGGPPAPGLLEAGMLLGAVGLFVLAFFWGLGRAPLMPSPNGVPPNHGVTRTA